MIYRKAENPSESVELTYMVDGQDIAPDLMAMYGYTPTYSDDGEETIATDEYEWWADMFARLEALDSSGINWGEYDLIESDLELRVNEMERIAGAKDSYRVDSKMAAGIATEKERASFKDRLVVLDTRPGWDGQTDALLYDPGAPKNLTPFVIASGFDAESMSWRSGSYRRDLMDALCEFRGTINPKWAISGCTPDDVTELHGDYLIDAEAAEEIAHEVNKRLSGVDDLYSEDIADCVEEWFEEGRVGKAIACEGTPESFAASAANRGAKIVPPDEIKALVDEYCEHGSHEDFCLLAAIEPSGWFTVCDNTSGECFVESFETVAGADAYMSGADPRKAREIDRSAALHPIAPTPSSIAQSAAETARDAASRTEPAEKRIHQ